MKEEGRRKNRRGGLEKQENGDQIKKRGRVRCNLFGQQKGKKKNTKSAALTQKG